jgi:hypothetical protein
MELIVLNVGLGLGVITPTFYSMMVVMALVTTATTAPLLNLLGASNLKSLSQNRRGLSLFPMPCEEKGTVPLSAAGSGLGSKPNHADKS